MSRYDDPRARPLRDRERAQLQKHIIELEAENERLQKKTADLGGGIKAIENHIAECDECLERWRIALHKQPDLVDLRLYEEHKAFRDGLKRTLKYLADTGVLQQALEESEVE